MTLPPIWRTRFFSGVAAALALFLAVDLAEGDYFWPVVCIGVLAGVLLALWQPLPLDAFLIGLAVAGYIIGNRGFAQISLAGRFPLLPAEAVLLVACSLLVVRCAWRRELPFRRDPMNLLLLAWIAVGCLRIWFDVRKFGFLALRDFALVYYAAFFFLGQEMSRDARSRRFYERVLLASCAVLLPVLVLLELYPNFFITTLTWRGEPLIYQKGDLSGTFVAVGAILYFLRFEARGGWWWAALSLLCAGCVLALNNRASMLGLVVAAGWLALGRRWRFAAALGLSSVCGIVAILLGASLLRIPWEQTPVYDLYERIISIADPTGQRTYTGSETFNKGDNNRFRWVWWGTVFDETVQEDPYLGLGFGTDLAERFVQEYFPQNEEFTVRSPHNVLLTIFARMGALGLVAFLAFVGAFAVQTWHAVRAGPEAAAYWCVAWTIFTSACLGVVLEGPMGAVLFWTSLGIAHGSLPRRGNAAVETEPAEKPAEPALPSAAARV